MTDYVLGDRGTVQVITDDYYDAEILQVFEELLIDRERVWNGEVRLVPEPDNPYQPQAIAVYADDLKLGRLSPEDSAAYWSPITRVVASGYDAVTRMQLSAVLRGVTG
ncbi:HIRAN domain-containing protein, partial [Rothia nasimurium]|uniref:HIRAN domain-containing protein n=2 Tax=Rothia nasimurium TaxID=85336 RepID=UPI001F3058C9